MGRLIACAMSRLLIKGRMIEWAGSLRHFVALDDGCRVGGALDDSVGLFRHCERSVAIQSASAGSAAKP